MCGIVCFSGKTNFNLDKINLLLYWNYKERGSDATGFYTPKTGLIKNCDKAEDFLVSQREKLSEDTMLIGHVRQGTVGKQNPSNAHPFEYKMEGKAGTIIGLQNGTLSNHSRLANEYGLKHADWDTDTQVLYQCMAKDCNPKVITKLEGSAALVWTDTSIKNNTTLYIYRNSERPLYYGKLPEGMYISSIEKSLKVIGCTDIKQFEEETLFTIKEGVITKENKVIVKKKPVSTNTSSTNSYSSTPINRMACNLKDRWLKADNNYTRCYGKDVAITKGKFYLCLGKDTHSNGDCYARVIDDSGSEVVASTYYFEDTSYYPSVSSKAVVMETVYDASDLTKKVFDLGEVIIPTSMYSSDKGTFICAVSTVNKVKYEIPIKMLRRIEYNGSEDKLTNVLANAYTNVKTVDEDTKVINIDSKNVDKPASQIPSTTLKTLSKTMKDNPIIVSLFKSAKTTDEVDELEELLDELDYADVTSFCELSNVLKVCNTLIDKIDTIRDDMTAQESTGDISISGKYFIEESLDVMESTIQEFFNDALYNTYNNDDLEYLGLDTSKTNEKD